MIELMQADPARLRHRNAVNIAAINFKPDEFAAEIRRHRIDYYVDLAAMVSEMVRELRLKPRLGAS